MIRFIYVSRPPSNGNDPEVWNLTIGMDKGAQRVEKAESAIEALRLAAKVVKEDASPQTSRSSDAPPPSAP